MILEPPAETDVEAIETFQDIKVSLSLDIIECHELILTESRLEKYRCNYQHLHQWFAIIYVLEEVAKRPDADFASRVWQVIDAVLVQPELLNKHGMKAEDRTRLLEAHGRALEAREMLLRTRSSAGIQAYSGRGEDYSNSTANAFAPAITGETSIPRIDPWQLGSSLFDVQDAQLNFNAFFWPSPSQENSSTSSKMHDLAHADLLEINPFVDTLPVTS